MIETGFVEAISKNLGSSDTASIVEKELEVTSVTGCVGVGEGFGIAKGIKERAECTNLISDLRLPFGVGREPEELVYKEVGTEALSGACDPPGRQCVRRNETTIRPKAVILAHLKMTDCDWFLRLMMRYTLAANS